MFLLVLFSYFLIIYIHIDIHIGKPAAQDQKFCINDLSLPNFTWRMLQIPSFFCISIKSRTKRGYHNTSVVLQSQCRAYSTSCPLCQPQQPTSCWVRTKLSYREAMVVFCLVLVHIRVSADTQSTVSTFLVRWAPEQHCSVIVAHQTPIHGTTDWIILSHRPDPSGMDGSWQNQHIDENVSYEVTVSKVRVSEDIIADLGKYGWGNTPLSTKQYLTMHFQY